ncbi:MAG: ATP-binding protein [Bacteroidetes bacterium]|nr:ATP-binding protein [Bacteroidota bacterium]
MFQRDILQQIIERVSEPRRFIQVLVGPRQTGKTTLIKQLLFQTAIPHFFITADDLYAADTTWIRREWANVRIRLNQSGDKSALLIIDEVQKVPNWSETIKKEWDADSFFNTNIKVILLGSSRLLLQKGLTESLAGRFELINVTHWSFNEMRDAFGWNLNQYIYYGGYPGSAPLISDEKRWKDYVRASIVESSISKDILMMTRIDKPALLKRLFDIGCAFSSQILSLSKVQGELQESGNLTTLSNYLNVLREAGLLSGLEKYAANIIRQRSSKPKFQIHNNALLACSHPHSFTKLQTEHDVWGRFAESAVGAHLINFGIKHHYRVCYWNEGGYEVDYVIEKDHEAVGIEVKSGKEGTNKGLALFQKQCSPRGVFVVGTNGIPFEEFLSMNPMDLFGIADP